MNILFLSTVFPDTAQPSRGAYNLQTCRALAQSHRVQVISPRPWTDLLGNRIAGHVFSRCDAAREAGIDVTFPTYWYPPKLLRARYGEFLWWSVRHAVNRIAANCPPDAVLSYWAHPDGEAAVRAARRFGVPVGVITGGSDVLLLPECPTRGERVRRVLSEADAVLTVSDGIRQAVVDLGVDGGKVHTVYQGVDADRFHPGSQEAARQRLTLQQLGIPSESPLLLWVGRMVDVKRLDVLIDGCAAMKSRCDFQLALIGDGPLRATVEQQVERQGLQGQVHFAGSVPPDRLGDWYRAADLTLLTSDSEGIPNVLRESLACGTPFVSTDVGSIRELAKLSGPDEPTGRLVPAGDPQRLCDAIVAMLAQGADARPTRLPPRTWQDRAADITRILTACGAGVSPRTNAPAPQGEVVV